MSDTRRGVIGSSDVAAVLGLSPYRGPFDVWCRIHGIPVRGGGDGGVDTDATRRGRLAEAGLREWAGRRLGVTLIPGPAFTDEPWVAPDPDGWLRTRVDSWWGHGQPANVAGRIGICEVKTGDTWEGWGPDGSDGVRTDYALQCLQQAAVSELRGVRVERLVVVATVQTFSGFDEPRLYDLPVRRDRIDALLGKLRAWYRRHVLEGEMPDPDASRACRAAIAARYAVAARESVEPTDADRELVARLVEARRAQRDAATVADQLSAELALRIGDAKGMRGLCSMTRTKGRTTLAASRLLRDHPDIHAAYSRTSAPSFTIRARGLPTLSTDTDEDDIP